MAVQENEKERAFFPKRQAEPVRIQAHLKGIIEKKELRLSDTIRPKLLKALSARARAIALEVYTEDKTDVRAQAREAMNEVRASRKRARKTGSEIKKLETKTRSIIAKLKAS